MVFLCHFDAESIRLVVLVLNQAEESVDVLLVGIDCIAFLLFRFKVQRPSVVIVTEHHNIVEIHHIGLLYGIRDIHLGHIFEFPAMKTGNADFLSVEITVIGTESQGSVRIVETHIGEALFRQCRADAVF